MAAAGNPWDDEARHEWEREGYAVDVDSDEEELDPATAAAQEMLDHLVDLYLTSVISAKSLCLLCHWASKAGITHPDVIRYAAKPTKHSGNYQKHLNTAMGFDDMLRNFDTISVPAYPRGGVGRGLLDLPLRAPHALLHDELRQNESVGFKLQEMVDNMVLPPCYFANPIVKASTAGSLPVPFALYCDGVQYSKNDSVIGLWLHNLVTESRGLVTIIRKSVMCQCGCRGWCTWYPILSWLRWSFQHLAEGTFPERTWLGGAFPEGSESARVVGENMDSTAVLLYCKGDWLELCERFGFPSPLSGGRPCFCCSAIGDQLYEPEGVSLVEQPWFTNDAESFERAASRCEQITIVSQEHREGLNSILKYDKRSHGLHGLALVADFPELGLLKGDRLEPSEKLLDIDCFLLCLHRPFL